MRCVSVYVVCPDDQAQPVAEKMQNIMIGYALEGFEAGLSVEPREDEDVIVFTPDDDDDDDD
jgi:hypothetical protein